MFNFGGDLSLFVLLIRAHDLDSLRMYGRRCVDLVWWMENALGAASTPRCWCRATPSAAGSNRCMPFHKVIFERSAQAGFPEVLFNLFPGMGAWNFTIRKAGFTVANEMILSGRLYTAEQLYRRGLVDLVVDDGEGEAAIEQVVRIRQTTACAARSRRCRQASCRADHLRVADAAIVDQWAETAMTLTDRDLRLMERLARAQVRKAGGADEGAVEEIKRHGTRHRLG